MVLGPFNIALLKGKASSVLVTRDKVSRSREEEQCPRPAGRHLENSFIKCVDRAAGPVLRV